jgi:hypothetical protein
MQVHVRDFDVDMTLGNNGITLTVYDNTGALRGKLRLGRATIEWCRGRTRMGNGVRKNWNQFIDWFGE